MIVQTAAEVQTSGVGAGTRPWRLGLFGGSFDPIHQGHLHVARAAQEAVALTRVAFVPAASPPHKPGAWLTPGHHRLEMVRLALAEEPSWCVLDLELRRPGPSYTYDTLRALPAAVGAPPETELFLLVGSDNLPDLPRWHRGREILELAQPIVVLREGDEPDQLLGRLARQDLDPALLARLERGLLLTPPVPGRATELRRRLAAGEDPGAALPLAVLDYVRRHRLYRPEDEP